MQIKRPMHLCRKRAAAVNYLKRPKDPSSHLVWPKWSRWPYLVSCGSQRQGIWPTGTTSTIWLPDYVHVCGWRYRTKQLGSLPLSRPASSKDLASLPAKITITLHLLTRIRGRPEVIRRRWRDSSHWVRRNGQGWFVWYPQRRRTWHFQPKQAKNTREVVYFHLHVYQKARTKRAIPHYLSERQKPNSPTRDTGNTYSHESAPGEPN